MDLFDLTYTLLGTGFVGIKSLLLLIPTKFEQVDEMVKSQIDNYFETNKEMKNDRNVREFITWMFNDQFSQDILGDEKCQFYLMKLSTLRGEVIELYTKQLKEIVNGNEYKTVSDLHSTIEESILQIMRLRLVIQPELQISRNVHPVSKIPYIAVKGFWIEDDGSKTRKITKSLGREDEFKLGKKDPKAVEVGRDKLREELYKRYQEIYPS